MRSCFGLLASSLFVALVISVTLSAPGNARKAPPWPTTEFEVFLGPPTEMSYGEEGQISTLLDLPTFSRPISPDLEKELEAALHKAAVEYQDMGFREPALEPIITRDDGSKAYRVYVCQPGWVAKFSSLWEACAQKAAHVPACRQNAGFRNVLYFNSDGLFKGERMSGLDYATVAHELFHAVHANTKSQDETQSCETNAWIAEGLADAVSIDMTREWWPTVSLSELGQAKEFGLREYVVELGDKKYKYSTSSFWRHLGEWHYAAQNNGGRRGGSAQTKSDYEFLVHLLDQRIEKPGNIKSEYKWLDQGLRSTPQMTTTLARVYSEFAATYADIPRTRILPGIGGTAKAKVPQGRLDKFLKSSFWKCPIIVLDGTNTISAHSTALRQVGSSCFKVHVTNVPTSASKDALVSISAGPAPAKELSPLWIGKSGGMEVAQILPFVREGRDDAPGYGMVSFKVEIGTPTVFIISNIAKNAEELQPVFAELVLSIEEWKSTLTTTQSTGPKPGKTAGNAPVRDAKGKHEEKLKQKFDQDSGKMTRVGAGTTKVKRGSGSAENCKPVRLRNNLCGPKLQIQLRLAPKALAATTTNTTGGWFKQLPSSDLGILMNQSMEDGGASINAIAQMDPDNIEGGSIKIRIPLVEYGFSGSFDNAAISVSKQGGGGYESMSSLGVPGVGPKGSARENERVPNGKVTIEQYTPQVLKGTFSAQLIDFEDLLGRPPEQAAPIAKTISGSFTAPNVFTTDKDFEVDEETMQSQFAHDMMDNPFMSRDGPLSAKAMMDPGEIRELCKYGFDESMIKAMGIEEGCGPASGGSSSARQEATRPDPRCTCDCEDIDAGIHEQCVPMCGDTYARCNANPLSAAEKAALKKKLEEAGMPPEVVKTYMDTMASMSADDQRAYIETLDMMLGQGFFGN